MLVGEDQQQSLFHLSIQYNAVQLLSGLVYSRAIIRVNDKDQALGAGEVVSPKRSDLVLTTNIPNVEFHILVCDGLDVESDGRDSRDILPQLEFVQDRCVVLVIDC